MVFSLVCTADFGLQPIGEMLQAVLKVPDAVLEVHDNRHLHVVLVPLCLTLHVLLTDATRQSLGWDLLKDGYAGVLQPASGRWRSRQGVKSVDNAVGNLNDLILGQWLQRSDLYVAVVSM
jgi:hypothetical protein